MSEIRRIDKTERPAKPGEKRSAEADKKRLEEDIALVKKNLDTTRSNLQKKLTDERRSELLKVEKNLLDRLGQLEKQAGVKNE